MNLTLQELRDAAAQERLIVKVAGHWWLARIVDEHIFDEGWLVHVNAGPHNARGYITNIENNRYGREFHILPEKEVVS